MSTSFCSAEIGFRMFVRVPLSIGSSNLSSELNLAGYILYIEKNSFRKLRKSGYKV